MVGRRLCRRARIPSLGFCQLGEPDASREDADAPVSDVLRLTTAGVSSNEIARRLGIAALTVRLNLVAVGAGFSLPLPGEMSDTVLEAPFTAVGTKQGHRHGEPNWAWVHGELECWQHPTVSAQPLLRTL